MRYFLELAYDGSSFHGWQRQPNADSVQQRIEGALAKVFQCEVPIVGAGRTDTGVHARQMYAHFDSPRIIEKPKSLLKGLNLMVGPAIALRRLLPVDREAHARFDATERSYKYFVIFEKSPFLAASSWYSPTDLDRERMNEAASLLTEVEDFTSFAKLHTDVKTNICDVRNAEWEEYDNPFGVPGIVFTVTADRFLRNMVRAVVGTLVDVGRRKLTVRDFKDIIEARDRCSAGTSMPPQGLFLWDVKYPSNIFLRHDS
ncbi:MAG: tRNA pseudouridine(38-40) synthase TruA [Muribaculaceae bacterium]|nr:tRNA pseudouridine(38-40) synthase TruA [Muribaculaceae bacterium]